MLSIDNGSVDIQLIANEWASRLKIFLTGDGHSYYVANSIKPGEKVHCETYQAKMVETITHTYIDLPENDKRRAKAYVDRFCNHVEFYAKASEKELKMIHDLCQLLKKNHPEVHRVLKQLFVDLYKDFVSVKNKPDDLKVPISYYFVEKLKLRTCPYCNRTYTFNIYEDNGKKARPEYDHFYDKEDNPLLAVSFFNLVPSCPICNHIKSTNALHVNPYFRGFDGTFRVFEKNEARKSPKPLSRIQLFNHDAWGDVRLDTTSADEKADMKTLGLDEFYKQHADYVEEIVEKAQAYREPMLSALSSTFQGVGYSYKQVFDFVWGKNIETARQINQPLSKLTKDILEQAGVINEEEKG